MVSPKWIDLLCELWELESTEHVSINESINEVTEMDELESWEIKI